MNDLSENVAQCICSDTIMPMAASGESGDMWLIKVGMDCGYWSKKIIHDYYLQSEAKIKAATTKWQQCIGITHKQKLSAKDTWYDMLTAGPKFLYTMETMSHDRKLYCHVYKSRTGGITLGLSTEHGAYLEWELVLASPADLKWYNDLNLSVEDRLNKSYQAIKVKHAGGITESLCKCLDAHFCLEVKSLDVLYKL